MEVLAILICECDLGNHLTLSDFPPTTSLGCGKLTREMGPQQLEPERRLKSHR
jgi:hypothetical protein